MKKISIFCFTLLVPVAAFSESRAEAILNGSTENFPPLLVHVKPAYPESALTSGTEGSCDVTFDINFDQGRVERAEISKCAPKGAFEESCLNAIKKWWFRPPATLGKKVVSKSLSATCRYH